jgi:hypothetical protein
MVSTVVSAMLQGVAADWQGRDASSEQEPLNAVPVYSLA